MRELVELAAGAAWVRMIPVASLMAGLSGRAVPDSALYPPALREEKAAAGVDPTSAAQVRRDIQNAMFGEGLKQIARKSAARQGQN